MKQYNALVIDDEKTIRSALVLMLTEYCPEIRVCGSAGSAREGREMLKMHEVDFIFLDISMPKEDGFTFLRSIFVKAFRNRFRVRTFNGVYTPFMT